MQTQPRKTIFTYRINLIIIGLLIISIFAYLIAVLNINHTLFIGLLIVISIFIVSIRKPIIILSIYPIVFLDAVQAEFEIGGFTPGVYLGFLVIIIGLIQIMSNYQKFKTIPKSWLIALFALPLCVLISFVYHRSDLRFVLSYAGQVLVVLTYCIVLSSEKDINSIIKMIILISIILAFSQIYIYFFGQPFDFLTSRVELSGYKRISGLARDPNYGSSVLAVGYMYLLGGILCEKNRFHIFIIKLACLAVLVIGVILSGSRAGLIGLLIGTVYYFLFQFWKKPIMIILLIAFIFFVWNIIPYIFEESLQDAYLVKLSPDYLEVDPSNLNRLERYQTGLKLLSDNYLLGFGDPELTFHNTYIDLVSFGGVFALVCYGFLYISIYASTFKFSVVKRTKYRNINLYNHATIFSILVIGLPISTYFEKAPWVVLGLSISSILLAKKELQRNEYSNAFTSKSIPSIDGWGSPNF